jgi:hypothetical protein
MFVFRTVRQDREDEKNPSGFFEPTLRFIRQNREDEKNPSGFSSR